MSSPHKYRNGFSILLLPPYRSFDLTLHQQNFHTGTIARLCAATDTRLHLIEPLGFSLEDRYLKRAGLDYWPHVRKTVWPDWAAFLADREPGRIVLTSARRGTAYHRFSFSGGDFVVLGPETRGLPGWG